MSVRCRVPLALALLLSLSLFGCNGRGERGDRSGEPPATPEPTATAGEIVVAVIGDAGTGEAAQYEVGEALCEEWARSRFDVVVTTGDNVYPHGEPDGFQERFFEPYSCLFDRGVRFHASLGNHDIETDGGRHQIEEEAFGMDDRYYDWSVGPVAFFVLDTNNLDSEQLDWLERSLAEEDKEFKVVVGHHPLYLGGSRYEPDPERADALVPRFEDGGVDLVLSGHEHLYLRAEAGGITYVTTGGGGGDLYPCASRPIPQVRVCEEAHHFLLLRVDTGGLSGEAIDVGGDPIDHFDAPAGPP